MTDATREQLFGPQVVGMRYGLRAGPRTSSEMIQYVREGLGSDLVACGPPPAWFRWRDRRRWRERRAAFRTSWIHYAETVLWPKLVEELSSSPTFGKLFESYHVFLDKLAHMDERPGEIDEFPRAKARYV